MPTRKSITYLSRKRSYAESFESERAHPPFQNLPTPPTSSPNALKSTSASVLNVTAHSFSQSQEVSTTLGREAYASSSPEQPCRTASKTPMVPSSTTTRPRLTQMIIDLGGNPQKRCKECGMEYVPSHAEDAKLHGRFHAASVGGVDVPTGLKDKWRVVSTFKQRQPKVSRAKGMRRASSDPVDVIVEVTTRDKASVRRWAKRVLDVAEKELGAVETTEAALQETDTIEDRAVDKYKAYLYVQGRKCVGYCLTERIFEARKGGNIPATNDGEPHAKMAATLGISRIWVSKDHRRLGVATELLDTAADRFDSTRIEKSMVAFSQPTEAGSSLAQTWFQRSWSQLPVYDESCRHVQSLKSSRNK